MGHPIMVFLKSLNMQRLSIFDNGLYTYEPYEQNGEYTTSSLSAVDGAFLVEALEQETRHNKYLHNKGATKDPIARQSHILESLCRLGTSKNSKTDTQDPHKDIQAILKPLCQDFHGAFDNFLD